MTHPAPPSAKHTLRIAILMADFPLEQTAATYGNYGGVFTKLLESARDELRKEGPEGGLDLQLDITRWDVCRAEEYPEWEGVDAVLITGSRANAFDSAPWILKLVDFTRRLLTEQSRIRVIGVCFGHQIVGRALDLPIERSSADWETSVLPMRLTPLGQELFKAESESISLHQMHRDIVNTTPQDLEKRGIACLGSTDVCKIQGMYQEGKFISVQGHPEFTEEIVGELLDKRKEMGIFTERMWSEAKGRVGRGHDGVRVASGFLRFAVGNGEKR